MIKIWAIIPVKSLTKTKSRLATVLSPEARANLTLKLLERLLTILADVECLEGVVVVSRDKTVCTLVQEVGHTAVSEPDGAGLNASIDFAVAQVVQFGATHTLILPSDLPIVTASDINLFLRQLIDGVPRNRVDLTAVICGDDDQMGTNGMLLPIGIGFQFRYGPNSFEQHIEEAKRMGFKTVISAIPNIQFDLDTVEDWRKYQLHTL